MRRLILLPLVALLGLIVPDDVSAQSKRRFSRAKPPKFTERDTQGIFFGDIFTEGFQGERPADLSKPAAKPTALAGGAAAASGAGEGPASGDGWSKFISATTIEDEIKAIKLQVDMDVTTEQQFIARGYEGSRRNFAVLALLFGAIAEYDGDVRFKEPAPGARDLFARSAANCKVGTKQSFNEAKKRKTDLQEILSGGASPAEPSADPNVVWASAADRSALMQRLEIAQQTNLQPWIGGEGEFKSHAEEAMHEAEIISAIAAALTKPGTPDGEDETYAGFAKSMRDAGVEVVEAVKLNNYEQARKAVGAIDQACTKCHELYRE